MARIYKKSGSFENPQSAKVRTLYVSNLSFDAQADIVEQVFDREGFEVQHVEMLKKGKAGQTRTCGLAAVTLVQEEQLAACVEKMDGQLVMARPMIVRIDKFVEDDAAYDPTKKVQPVAATAEEAEEAE